MAEVEMVQSEEEPDQRYAVLSPFARAIAESNLRMFVSSVRHAGTRAPTRITLGEQTQILAGFQKMLERALLQTPTGQPWVNYSEAILELLTLVNTRFSLSHYPATPVNGYPQGHPESLQFAKFYCIDAAAVPRVYGVSLMQYQTSPRALPNEYARFRVAKHGGLPDRVADMAAPDPTAIHPSAYSKSTFNALAESGAYVVNDLNQCPRAESAKIAKWFSEALAHSPLFKQCPIELRAPFVDLAA